MRVSVRSAVFVGGCGRAVSVEVDVADGVPGFTVVGVVEAACREVRDRVRTAIVTSGLGWPDRRVTVNVVPTDLPKTSAGLDLAIAVAVLAADGQLPAGSACEVGYLAQLNLNGELRPVAGLGHLLEAIPDQVPVVVAARDDGIAGLDAGDRVRAAGTLREVREMLTRAAGRSGPFQPGAK